jgi:membrane dipeptidase
MFFLIACTSPAPIPPAPPPPQPPPPPPVWAADLHVDTVTELGDRQVGFDDPGLEAGLPALTAGGTNVVVNVLWPPRDSAHEPFTWSQLDRFDAELAKVSDRMALARTPAEADAIVASGRIATLLALEGAHGISQSGVDGLRRLHGRGLRVLGLTWSLSNRFGGSSGDGGAGLTDDGRALVGVAQELGILVDLSHASRPTTLEVCAVSKAPLIASHSGALSKKDVPRNLTDEEIRCIAGTGGMIGVNFHADFVSDPPVGIAQVADQVDALVKVAGIDHVGIGSDWDGDIHVPDGLENARTLPALWTALTTRGYDDAALARIRGGNFRRVWTEASR